MIFFSRYKRILSDPPREATLNAINLCSPNQPGVFRSHTRRCLAFMVFVFRYVSGSRSCGTLSGLLLPTASRTRKNGNDPLPDPHLICQTKRDGDTPSLYHLNELLLSDLAGERIGEHNTTAADQDILLSIQLIADRRTGND